MLDARVVKRRPAFTVDVALRVPDGTACGLFGVSGAGKSTVPGCIAGVETPDDGRVTAGETTLFPPSLPLHRRPLGYLTQDADLFPHLGVDENVAFGIADADASSLAWIAELRERLELGPIWRSPAREISGGQARRVAL